MRPNAARNSAKRLSADALTSMSVALADAFEKEDLREGVCDEALVVADDMKGRGKSIGLQQQQVTARTWLPWQK